MRRTALTLLVCLAVATAPGCKKKSSRNNPLPGPAPTNPVVTGITPPDGDVAGGTSVTIQGSDFVVGAQVSIGGALAGSINVASATSITCTTPLGTVGPATVLVTNPDNQSASLVNGFTYTSAGGNNAPTFSSVAPASGPAAGGTAITITGTGFYTGATVTVGGANATSVSVVSGTTITGTTPTGTAGARDIVVTNADLQNVTGTGVFTFVNPPSISGFTPANGPQSGGGTITIGGADFVSGVGVTFNGVNAPVTLFGATALEVTLPASSTSGVATVVVTNPDTQAATDSTNFTYDPPPAPTGVNPNNGPLAGGNTVTVVGTNFVSGGGLAVSFGGTAATAINWLSATQIECQPPTGSGTVAVSVTNPDGQSGQATGAYVYNPLPTISSVQLNNGPLAGGNTVTINGANFLSGPNPTVTIDGNSAPVTLFGTAALEVTVPTGGSPGAKNVVVTNRDGQQVTSVGAYTYNSGGGGFTVTNVSPGGGTANGGTPVTITGTGFQLGATVVFGTGNQATSVIVVSDTTITARTPSGTGSVTVTVNNPSASASWGTAWVYGSTGTQPAISAIAPTTGVAAGGTTVTITSTGTNFGTAPAVTINGVSATVTGSSSSSITITAPAALHCVAGGPQFVYVTDTTSGETSTGFSGYTYTPDITESLTVGTGLPDVAIDGAGTIHQVFQTNPTSGFNDLIYRQSTDGGKTWVNGGVASGRLTQNGSNNSTNARIAAQGNTVFIVWLQSGTPTIQYNYSTDNGANWATSPPGGLSLPNNGSVIGAPDVAMDGNGRVYVVWTELGNVGPWATDVDIWQVNQTPSNIGTATDSKLSPGGDFCSQPSVDADGNGNAIVAWHQTPNASVVSIATGIDYTRTTNSGTSWATAGTIQAASAITSSVGVALAGANAVVTFVEATQSPSTWAVDSYYSTNTGQSWTAGATLRSASTTSISAAAVAADGGGFFTCVWSEVGASQTNIFCTQSSDIGVTWTSPVAFSPSAAASTWPRIAGGAGGNWSVVWDEWNAANNGGSGGNDSVHW